MSTKTVAMSTHRRRNSSGWLTTDQSSLDGKRGSAARRERRPLVDGPETQPALEAVGERQAGPDAHQREGGCHLELRVEREAVAAHDVAPALTGEPDGVVDTGVVARLERVGRVAVSGEARVAESARREPHQ